MTMYIWHCNNASSEEFFSVIFTETSHKKLISQLEEAVQNQLDDAHRRITAVNEACSLFITYYLILPSLILEGRVITYGSVVCIMCMSSYFIAVGQRKDAPIETNIRSVPKRGYPGLT